jgi:hypothetical protein
MIVKGHFCRTGKRPQLGLTDARGTRTEPCVVWGPFLLCLHLARPPFLRSCDCTSKLPLEGGRLALPTVIKPRVGFLLPLRRPDNFSEFAAVNGDSGRARTGEDFLAQQQRPVSSAAAIVMPDPRDQRRNYLGRAGRILHHFASMRPPRGMTGIRQEVRA